jgi:hypothetical protein
MSEDFRKQLYRNFNQKPTEELIEIWQTNDRLEWSEMSLNVIREILIERLGELPAQNEAITEVAKSDNEGSGLKEQKEKLKYNWNLPLFGAIGFGISFALMGAIMLTIYNIAQNFFAYAFGEVKAGIETGALRGIVVGGIGGAALGLAHKDKKHAYYFALAGAVGFGIAFALVISINSHFVSEIGWTIIELMGGPAGVPSLEAELAQGLGIGTIIGAVGGLGLGLASPKYRAISSLLLCVAGIIVFGNIFAFGSIVYDGRLNSSWNAWGGALGGAILGAVLALYYLIAERIYPKKN